MYEHDSGHIENLKYGNMFPKGKMDYKPVKYRRYEDQRDEEYALDPTSKSFLTNRLLINGIFLPQDWCQRYFEDNLKNLEP